MILRAGRCYPWRAAESRRIQGRIQPSGYSLLHWEAIYSKLILNLVWRIDS